MIKTDYARGLLCQVLCSFPRAKKIAQRQANCNAENRTAGIGPKICPFTGSVHIRLDQFDHTAKQDGPWQKVIKRAVI